MTRDQILQMPASEEMDALVAEHVMGWRRGRLEIDCDPAWIGPTPPEWKREPGAETIHAPLSWAPSLEIEDAWEVVEKAGLSVVRDDALWMAGKAEWEPHEGMYLSSQAEAEPVELAICRAALLTTLRDE